MTTDPRIPTDPAPDIREQERAIAATREDMGQTLEAIEDRVHPGRIKDRQVDRLRARWDRARGAVMGQAEETRGRASELAGETQQMVQHAPERVEDATRGNPLAAGAIAFGVGALVGSMLPASRAEQQMASTLREEFEEPVRDELQRAGGEVKDHMREHTEHAMEEAKASAQHAMETVRDETRDDPDGQSRGSQPGSVGPS